MKNKLVLLRNGNSIVKVLGQFRTNFLAKGFIADEYPEFRRDSGQWSEFESGNFITIE